MGIFRIVTTLVSNVIQYICYTAFDTECAYQTLKEQLYKVPTPIEPTFLRCNCFYSLFYGLGLQEQLCRRFSFSVYQLTCISLTFISFSLSNSKHHYCLNSLVSLFRTYSYVFFSTDNADIDSC